MLEDFKREKILEGTKRWFRDVVAPNHVKNTKKLANPQEFDINPFLVKYLARFLTGNSSAESIAKALIYPRVLGTSINTSFGQNAQKFVSDVLGSFGSAIPGIDIEFFDQIDGRKKYCQAKLGPNTINKDDVETIERHFSSVKNIARTNNLKLEFDDLVVGVLYGEDSQLSTHYKNIRDKFHHPVFIGKEFWKRLTGAEHFYYDLCTAISEVAIEYDGSHLLQQTIANLSSSDVIKELADE